MILNSVCAINGLYRENELYIIINLNEGPIDKKVLNHWAITIFVAMIWFKHLSEILLINRNSIYAFWPSKANLNVRWSLGSLSIFCVNHYRLKQTLSLPIYITLEIYKIYYYWSFNYFKIFSFYFADIVLTKFSITSLKRFDYCRSTKTKNAVVVDDARINIYRILLSTTTNTFAFAVISSI